MNMTKTLIALAAAAVVGLGAVATSTPANAQHWHHGGGGAVAAGVIGGIAAGALIAGASRPAYGYGYGYGGYAPVYGPPCFWRRERFFDGYGWRVRRVRVCG
jgi:hypothetical protein